MNVPIYESIALLLIALRNEQIHLKTLNLTSGSHLGYHSESVELKSAL